MLLCFLYFFIFFFFVVVIIVFSDFLYKSICYWYSPEMRQQVDAIQIVSHNICLYKEVNKKYTGCILKTTDCLTVRAYRGLCGN